MTTLDLTAPVVHGTAVLEPFSPVGALQILSTVDVATDIDGDWPGLRPSPDRVFIRGRYVHGGEPANRNGHLFRTEQLEDAHKNVPHAPLNLLHRSKHVVGHYAASRLIFPTPKDYDIARPHYDEAPFVETASVLYSYVFPDEYRAVRTAYDKGMAFQSMECIPAENTCYDCGLRAAWQGYKSDAYCEHLNKPQAARWFEHPLFVGGGLVIPPARPGWKDAALTRIAAHVEAHPEHAEQVYKGVAAAAPHLNPSDVEAIMALLISHGVPADLEATKKVAPLWEALTGRYPDIDFVPPAEVSAAVADAVAARSIKAKTAADVLLRAQNLAEGRPQPPATVRRIHDSLTIWKPVAPELYALWGGDAALAWAVDLVARMDQADAMHAASAEEHRSAIVVARPSPHVAAALAAAGDMPVDEIHVTIVFFGKGVEDGQLGDTGITRDQIAAVVESTVAGREPLRASVGGIGVFRVDDQDCTWAAIDCPGLAELYTDLTAALNVAEIPFSSEHGFTAHSTIAYTAPGQGPKEVPLGLSWEIDSLELWWGGDRSAVIPFHQGS